ncbi:MAG: M50 family metallopeptidase [Clostridia bacterium]|nr:M50 family metallopeptidase [Clostridia bacterium]
MKLKFSITPATCILLFCMIATTPLPMLVASLLAAVIHESGHILAAKLLCINLTHMKLDILGARLTTTGKLYSYPALVALCIAGPLINFLCFGLLFPFSENNLWLSEFCLSNLSLGMLNLVPIDGFDGGRILHGLMCKLFPFDIAERISIILSFCSIFLLWLLSVWLLLRTGSSLTLFVFTCCLFSMLFV